MLCLGLVLWLSAAHSAPAFSFEDLSRRAKQLAASPYQKPVKNLPAALSNLSYENWRDIRFRRDRDPWSEARLPFELSFFHQGRNYDLPVKIHQISAAGVREIAFDPAAFDYGPLKLEPGDLKNLGYAGFRVSYPLNTPRSKDEVVAFLGASYFRALGKGQVYGQSARGLAIDTGQSSGEEFPRFTEFWIRRPEPSDKQLTIYALLDSARAAGAYRFVVKPGDSTEIDVKARLFLREGIGKLGQAPLTSMYLFGENQRPASEDYRPEVHDSDGLSIASGSGEWIWRPLVNPRRLLITSFEVSNPQGYGLFQRDRQFLNYQDLGARFEARPSVWVEPVGQWGAGRVELVQIPSPNELNDNVVAFWVPAAPARPGSPYDLEYRLYWQKNTEQRPPLAWVTQTRRGAEAGSSRGNEAILLVVDFDGPALRRLEEETKVDAMVTVDGNAKLLETRAFRNEAQGGWRLTIRLRRSDDKKPVELRAYLGMENVILSETWSYIIPPE